VPGDATAGENLVDIRNNTGTLTLNVVGSTFQNNALSNNGGEGLQVTSTGSAVINLNVSHTTFANLKSAGIETYAKETSTMNVNITDGGVAGFGNNFVPNGQQLRAIGLNAEDFARLNFNIDRNVAISGNGGSTIGIFGKEGRPSTAISSSATPKLTTSARPPPPAARSRSCSRTMRPGPSRWPTTGSSTPATIRASSRPCRGWRHRQQPGQPRSEPDRQPDHFHRFEPERQRLQQCDLVVRRDQRQRRDVLTANLQNNLVIGLTLAQEVVLGLHQCRLGLGGCGTQRLDVGVPLGAPAVPNCLSA
jgi:hypothetical protein